MIRRETVRYLNNDDVSSISFRKFNSLPSDKYPSYSLCFKKAGGIFFTRRHLTKLANTDKRKLYWKIFTGKDVNKIIQEHDVEEEDIDKIRNLSDFSELTMDLKEMTNFFTTRNDQNELIEKWHLKFKRRNPSNQNYLTSTTNTTNWPFYVSYMNPEKKCFTRKVDFQKHVIKKNEKISLNKDILNEMTKAIGGQFYLTVTIHHPRHFFRSYATVAHFKKRIKMGSYTRWNINVSEVKVIRKRHDANRKCNPHADDQDDIFRKSVIKEIGCIPPYWKTMVTSNDPNVSFCETSTQLEKAYNYTAFTKDLKRIGKILLRNENEPCDQTSIISHVEPFDGFKGDLQVYFFYNEGHYIETRNSQAYLIQDLLSSAGGYIGMFLGVGLLQIPEIVSTLYGLASRTFTALQIDK